MWKGGRINKDGYVILTLDPSHPYYCMTTRYARVPEHRIVMAVHLGRPLRDDETVHHINGVRHDNRIENLQLRSSAHGQGSAWVCADCGSHNLQPLPIGE